MLNFIPSFNSGSRAVGSRAAGGTVERLPRHLLMMAGLATACSLVAEVSRADSTTPIEERRAAAMAAFQAAPAEPDMSAFVEAGYVAAPIAFSDKLGLFMTVDTDLRAFNVMECELEKRAAQTVVSADNAAALASDTLVPTNCAFLSDRWVPSSPAAAQQFRIAWRARAVEAYEAAARADGRGAGFPTVLAGRYGALAAVSPELARMGDDVLQGAIRAGVAAVGFDRFMTYPSLDRAMQGLGSFGGANLASSAALNEGVRATVMTISSEAMARTLREFADMGNGRTGAVAQRSSGAAIGRSFGG